MKQEYTKAFDYLTDCMYPRRKYAPEHWLVPLYFAGSRIGWALKVAITRNPLVVLCHGLRDGWGWD